MNLSKTIRKRIIIGLVVIIASSVGLGALSKLSLTIGIVPLITTIALGSTINLVVTGVMMLSHHENQNNNNKQIIKLESKEKQIENKNIIPYVPNITKSKGAYVYEKEKGR